MTAYPLYMTDEQIAIAVLGKDRVHEWPRRLARLESEYAYRLPPISPLMGGRFWPDVVKYFSSIEQNEKANEAYLAAVREAANKRQAAPSIDPKDDILRGADAIAAFVYGDKRHRRKVYNLAATSSMPTFKLGAIICARKSTLLNWMKAQEAQSLNAPERSPPNL
jgi:hypothetical protein